MYKNLLGVSVIFLAGVFSIVFILRERQDVVEAKQSMRLSFTVVNKTRELIEKASFSVLSPQENTVSQKIMDINASHEFVKRYDSEGNVFLDFDLKVMPPLGSKIVTVTFDLIYRKPYLNKKIDSEQYLGNSKYLYLEDKSVELAANNFVDDDNKPLEIYNWLARSVNNISYIAEDRGAKYALTELKGDCTEFMYAFVALARYLDIPSRGVPGFALEPGAVKVTSKDYHNWAEYHDGARWVMVDPQKQQFDTSSSVYVAFRYLGSSQTQIDNTHRFLTFDKRLSVKMN